MRFALSLMLFASLSFAKDRTATEALLTHPLENFSTMSLTFTQSGALLTNGAPMSIDVFEMKRVDDKTYTAKGRVSSILPGRVRSIEIKRDPLLANFWNYNVDGYYVNVPFIGPVMQKPIVHMGLPIFGNKQKVTHYFTLPKLGK